MREEDEVRFKTPQAAHEEVLREERRYHTFMSANVPASRVAPQSGRTEEGGGGGGGGRVKSLPRSPLLFTSATESKLPVAVKHGLNLDTFEREIDSYLENLDTVKLVMIA